MAVTVAVPPTVVSDPMARLLIVSNRLPVTIRVEDGQVQLIASTGGLATGLRGPHERSQGRWIGWPGSTAALDPGQIKGVQQRLEDLRIVPVMLSAEEVQGDCEGISNELLWPVFHSLLGQVPVQPPDFAAYERVNELFADVVVDEYRPGDTIWVHDYQLMRVPELIRRRLPDATVGFFLHVPFPPAEVFRTLPAREQLLRGLLGADLIGFHAPSHMRQFASAVTRVLGVSTVVDTILWEGRPVRLGVFPKGVDAAAFTAMAAKPEILAQADALRRSGRVRVLVGIDRLDYTKGIPRRLLAYEKLLVQHPELQGSVQLVQVVAPSRTTVEAYGELRDQVDRLVGRINGSVGTPHWTPVQYVSRALSQAELVALYRAADVMAVTPLRDGMNLVAKEFVACRGDLGGVLVLSEFTAAATELAAAVQLNPYDIDGVAEAFYRALVMPESEQRLRMRSLRQRVETYDVHRWVRFFLDELSASVSGRHGQPPIVSPSDVLGEVLSRLRCARHLVMLLDYDGTLQPFAPTPELAAPDPEVLALLGRLARTPRFEVHIVSGRSRETLEPWLATLPLALHAEHGAWSRGADDIGWTPLGSASTAWRPAALAILDDFAARTPGAIVEEKTFGLAWHYRMADPEYGASQANELKLHLTMVLANEPVEVLLGDNVIELRPHGLHKGRVVAPILARLQPGWQLMAMGDDRTDEDLFAALPPTAVAVHVGPGASATTIRLADVASARRFLRALLDESAPPN